MSSVHAALACVRFSKLGPLLGAARWRRRARAGGQPDGFRAGFRGRRAARSDETRRGGGAFLAWHARARGTACDGGAHDAAVGDASNEEPLVRVIDLWKQFPDSAVSRRLAAPTHGRAAVAGRCRRLARGAAPASSSACSGRTAPGKRRFSRSSRRSLLPTEAPPPSRATMSCGDAASVRTVIAPVLANERSLYWRLSARENLELFAALLRLPPRETTPRVSAMRSMSSAWRTLDAKWSGSFPPG